MQRIAFVGFYDSVRPYPVEACVCFANILVEYNLFGFGMECDAVPVSCLCMGDVSLMQYCVGNNSAFT